MVVNQVSVRQRGPDPPSNPAPEKEGTKADQLFALMQPVWVAMSPWSPGRWKHTLKLNLRDLLQDPPRMRASNPLSSGFGLRGVLRKPRQKMDPTPAWLDEDDEDECLKIFFVSGGKKPKTVGMWTCLILMMARIFNSFFFGVPTTRPFQSINMGGLRGSQFSADFPVRISSTCGFIED